MRHNPSPEEIAQRAAEIRQSWDVHTRFERLGPKLKRRRGGRLLYTAYQVAYGGYDDEWILLTRYEDDPRDGVRLRADIRVSPQRFQGSREVLWSEDGEV